MTEEREAYQTDAEVLAQRNGMKAEMATIMGRLETDLPVVGSTMGWLDRHSEDISLILKNGDLAELEEMTGIARPSVLRWARAIEKRARSSDVAQATHDAVDAGYLRGQVDALKWCIESLLGRQTA